DNRLPIVSQRGMSWTYTQFKLNGMEATDSYQPGRPLILPDVQALDEISVRSGFAQTTATSYGPEVAMFFATPRERWHATLTTVNTGSIFAGTNLPANPGFVKQSDYFKRFSRDSVQLGGPINRWADLFVSATGQWSKQTAPMYDPGNDQRSRLLFGNI